MWDIWRWPINLALAAPPAAVQRDASNLILAENKVRRRRERTLLASCTCRWERRGAALAADGAVLGLRQSAYNPVSSRLSVSLRLAGHTGSGLVMNDTFCTVALSASLLGPSLSLYKLGTNKTVNIRVNFPWTFMGSYSGATVKTTERIYQYNVGSRRHGGGRT